MRQASRGGGHTLQFDNTGGGAQGNPEHVRDVAMLRDAIAKVQRKADAQRLNNDPGGRATHRFLRVLKSLAMHMAGQAHHPLTVRQRAMCMNALGITELPPVPEAQVPEVLRVLPKKPPQRRRDDGDD